MSRARAWLTVALLAAPAGVVAADARADSIAAFSSMSSGDVTEPWRLQAIRGRPVATFRIIDADGGVVEAASTDAVASLIHPLDVDPASGVRLSWRWRIEEAVAASNLYEKSGDDFPARVYALFDYELGRLPFGERWKLRIARLLYGKWVPAAALCYVPADNASVGTIAPNAYSDRLRMIVVDAVATGHWRSFERDVAADFSAAFGEPAPRLIGVAIAIDTDDTGETARARFGDLSLHR